MTANATYTIGELAQAANVTTRTIRYYVAQGLLPPPHSGGRAASYGDEHLRRLELIKLLKQEFLPLNEIRALLDGLDGDAVHNLLKERRQPPLTLAPETAKEYLRALLFPPAEASLLLRQVVAEKAQGLPASSSPAQPLAARARSGLFGRRSRVSPEAVGPMEEADLSQEVAAVWQRYPLHPDVELHIRRPPTDAELGARLGRLIADIRCLVAEHSS